MKYFFILVENKKTFEKTCYIVNPNYELQTTITPVFDDAGEFTKEIKRALKEFKINKYKQRKKIFFGATMEEGLENLRFELEEIPKLEKYLTPEMEERLINLFKKKMI